MCILVNLPKRFIILKQTNIQGRLRYFHLRQKKFLGTQDSQQINANFMTDFVIYLYTFLNTVFACLNFPQSKGAKRSCFLDPKQQLIPFKTMDLLHFTVTIKLHIFQCVK